MYSKTRHRKKFAIPLLLSITLFVFGCSTSSFKESLHTTLELKELNAKFTLINGSSETKVLDFTSGCQYGYTVETNGKKIYEWPVVCPTVITEISLDPSEEKIFEFSLKDKVIFKSGTYKLKAYISEQDGLSNEVVFKVR